MEIKTLASGSTGNCYIISAGGNSIMIECGIPIKRIKERSGFTLHGVDAVVLSHEH